MLIPVLISIAAIFIIIERACPSVELPQVRGWWRRIVLINAVQAGIVIVAGMAWDRWFQKASWLQLSQIMSPLLAASVAYLVSTLVYYFWHRFRHESQLFWRLCHQLHHSASRIELLTSFYKHPLEIVLNSILSAALVFGVLGCDATAGALYTGMTAVAEYFYHWNIRTPRWLGYFIQRPESHRVHHQRARHSGNYADLPIWDMLFGTFDNPKVNPAECGFTEPREQMLKEMLAFKDVHQLPLPPTCAMCSKRSACAVQKITAMS